MILFVDYVCDLLVGFCLVRSWEKYEGKEGKSFFEYFSHAFCYFPGELVEVVINLDIE